MLALPASASALKFSTPAGSPIEGLPLVNTMASADFNGDGRDDLASSTGSNVGGISIRLAQADGSWAAPSSVDAGFGTYSFATGDFNNDGKVDLALYRTEGNGTRVFLGNGDGTFGSAVAVTTGFSNSVGSFRALEVGDLSGDGNQDILFPLNHGDYAIAFGNGDGTFSPANASYVTGAPAGTDDRFYDAAIGDFNGDSDMDFALGMNPSSLDPPTNAAVFVMLGDGAGNFSAAPIHGYQFSQPEGYVGRVWSVAAGNFNGDGRADLAISTRGDNVSSTTGTIQVFLGDVLGLNGGSNIFRSDHRPGPVLTGDYDDDGYTDLSWLERIVPNGPNIDRVVIARGNGDGTFTAVPDDAFVFSDTTVSSTDMVQGHFGTDDALDFATGFGNSGTIRLLQNQIDPVTDRATIDFGDVVINSGVKLQSVLIGNAGGPTATIDQVSITGEDAGAFSLASGGCAGEVITTGCLQGVNFNPTVHDGFEANLHITFEDSSEVLDVPLAANVVAPAATFDPNPLNFGQAWINTSKTRTLQVTSSGDAVLFISDLISITGPEADLYEITSDGCSNRNLAPGDSCFIDIKLNADGSIGDFESAYIDLDNDGYLSHQGVFLYYTGINPGITINPTSENFGPVTVGSSEFQTFTVTSSGTTDLEIDDILLVGDTFGDFEIIDNDCPATLAVDDSCSFEVEFAPNYGSSTSRSAQVEIGTNLPVYTQVIQLSGTARQPEGSIDVDEVYDFGEAPIGSSATRTFTVTSTGSAPLQIEEAWVDGPFNADNERFSISNDTCSGAQLAVGQTCSYRVTFAPDERREFLAFTGVYNNDNFDESVELNGKGIQPGASFNSNTHDFGSATLGASDDRPKHTFTLSSTGIDPVAVDSLAITGANAADFKLADANVCSTGSIPNGETCQITVTFDPQSGSAGSRSAKLVASTNAGQVEANLSGTAAAALTYRARMTVKFRMKARVGKKLKITVTVKNTGTGTLNGATLRYTAKQGKTGKASMSKRLALPGIAAGKQARKTITINLRKSKFKKGGKKTLVQKITLTRQGTRLAARSGTTRLDFGQAKIRHNHSG